MISHRNLQVNFEQLMRSFFADSHVKVPPDLTIVSWLPFYHDMGLVLGVCAPILGGYRARADQPGRRSWRGRPGGCGRWPRILMRFRRRPTSPSTWPPAKPPTADLAGLDLGGVLGIISGAERVEPATLQRFVDRFAHFNFRDHMMRPSYGLAEATVFVAAGTWSESATGGPLRCRRVGRGPRRAVCGRRRHRAGQIRSAAITRRCGSSTATRNRECPPDVVGEIWVHGDNVAEGYWGKPPEEQQLLRRDARRPFAGHP